MGKEASCEALWGKRSARGKALLETHELIFRGEDFRLRVPFTAMKGVVAEGGTLRFAYDGAPVCLELGKSAAAWAEKIRTPRSRIEKLGVNAGHLVCVIGVPDLDFAAELAARGAKVKTRASNCADLIFLGANSPRDLARIEALKRSMDRDGCLWIIRPKGAAATVTEKQSRVAAHSAGLVDVKVAAFSATHTAEKYVVPRKDR